MKKLIVTLSLILACFSLFAADMDPKILFPDHHLCLEAVGKVVMKADKAEFSFSTTGYGSTLRAAVTSAKDKTSELTASLVTIGIDPQSFSTNSFTSGKNRNSYLLTDKKDYRATIFTSISLRDLSKLDEAVLILTDKKADNLSEINYSLDDPSAAKQQAREIALNRIVEQRDTFIRMLGVTITDVQLIDEAPYETLPWGSQTKYYTPKGSYPSPYNVMVRGGRADEVEFTVDDQSSGGFYSPEVTVETMMRVIYRIGMDSR
ncbi:MAG: SIMPL domain-containing protein [Candidatus Cloacimonetes bacterium]|nr:SIMPL domain-containing protein [Candidatus Cloacimonadota bacterium]